MIIKAAKVYYLNGELEEFRNLDDEIGEGVFWDGRAKCYNIAKINNDGDIAINSISPFALKKLVVIKDIRDVQREEE
jgi:hypothetical protein